VTISFDVVPVPFTDEYQIQVEQTFQTHVPAPVMVLNPTYVNFNNVTPGFEADFTVNVENYGLIQMTDVTIAGQQSSGVQLTPLITYFPLLLPMQSVDVPFTLTYETNAAPVPGQQDDPDKPTPSSCFAGAAPFGGLLDPNAAVGLAAIFNGQARCATDNSPEGCGASMGAVVGLGIALGVVTALNAEFPESIISFAAALGCIFNFGYSSPSGGGNIPNFPSSLPQAGALTGCFAPDTPVLMADGSTKPIANIQIHDLVRTGTHLWNTAEVNCTYELMAESEQQIQFTRPGATSPQQVMVSGEHLFWVDGKGWLAASRINQGDWLIDEAGERVPVVGNQATPVKSKVYTLSLSGDGAFYANGLLVHDLCGQVPSVMSAPVARGAK
jgi:hypothetical protein